jgi:RHS repeat-associated protein
MYGVTTADAINPNPFQYTGRENDGDGLYFYRARYYDALQGRFISQDPIGLRGGMDVYAYVHGNPLSRKDPLGLDDGFGAPSVSSFGIPESYVSATSSSSSSCGCSNSSKQIQSYLNQHNGNGEAAWWQAATDRYTYPNDLDLRDTEHYLSAYWNVQNNSYQWGVQLVLAAGYTPFKVLDNSFGKLIWPDATPPSWSELSAGLRGANDGLFGRSSGRCQ